MIEAFIFWSMISSVICGLIANSKKREVGGWIFAGILFGWIAIICAICVSNKGETEKAAAEQRAAAIAEAQSKTCPRCAESVKRAALVCRFCGHEFDAASIEAATDMIPVYRPVTRDVNAAAEPPTPYSATMAERMSVYVLVGLMALLALAAFFSQWL